MESPTLEPHQFRALMAGFPTGVAVVTTERPDGTPMGLTCSSVCSVSLNPPVLLVCLRNESPALPVISTTASFSVNLLEHSSQHVAELFASGSPDRFEQIDWRADSESGGPHLHQDAHSIADCAVVRTDEVGDHTVVIGEVRRVRFAESRRPLLYGLREYYAWPWADRIV